MISVLAIRKLDCQLSGLAIRKLDCQLSVLVIRKLDCQLSGLAIRKLDCQLSDLAIRKLDCQLSGLRIQFLTKAKMFRPCVCIMGSNKPWQWVWTTILHDRLGFKCGQASYIQWLLLMIFRVEKMPGFQDTNSNSHTGATSHTKLPVLTWAMNVPCLSLSREVRFNMFPKDVFARTNGTDLRLCLNAQSSIIIS